jgi:four helix bundle protein
LTKIERFEDLICWQQARDLVKIVYEASNEGPMAKDFDMRSQIRRAAISTMNNIAEGVGRYSKREFIRFLEISSASASEVKSVSYAALDLNYWDQKTVTRIQDKAESVKSLDLGLIKYLSGKK